jgi:hypothetical protein
MRCHGVPTYASHSFPVRIFQYSSPLQICAGPETEFQSSVPYTGIFFPGILEQVTGRPDTWFAGPLYPGFLRGFFGKASGIPEAFPNTSRTLPEENRLRTMENRLRKVKRLSGRREAENGEKQNSRIRYRTLKSGFRAPPYLQKSTGSMGEESLRENGRARKPGRLPPGSVIF